MSKVSREFLSQRLDAGMNLDQLAAAAGITRGQLRAIMGQYGLKPRIGPVRKLPAVHFIVHRIAAGEHPETIAEDYGVTANAVHVALKRDGWTVKKVLEAAAAEAAEPRRRGFPASVFGLRPGHGLGGDK